MPRSGVARHGSVDSDRRPLGRVLPRSRRDVPRVHRGALGLINGRRRRSGQGPRQVDDDRIVVGGMAGVAIDARPTAPRTRARRRRGRSGAWSASARPKPFDVGPAPSASADRRPSECNASYPGSVIGPLKSPSRTVGVVGSDAEPVGQLPKARRSTVDRIAVEMEVDGPEGPVVLDGPKSDDRRDPRQLRARHRGPGAPRSSGRTIWSSSRLPSKRARRWKMGTCSPPPSSLRPSPVESHSSMGSTRRSTNRRWNRYTSCIAQRSASTRRTTLASAWRRVHQKDERSGARPLRML